MSFILSVIYQYQDELIDFYFNKIQSLLDANKENLNDLLKRKATKHNVKRIEHILLSDSYLYSRMQSINKIIDEL